MRRAGLVSILGLSFMLTGCESVQRTFAWYGAKEAWNECNEERPGYCILSVMYLSSAIGPIDSSNKEETPFREIRSP